MLFSFLIIGLVGLVIGIIRFIKYRSKRIEFTLFCFLITIVCWMVHFSPAWQDFMNNYEQIQENMGSIKERLDN
jgi:hypothetical protein